MDSIEDLCSQIRILVDKVVKRNLAKGILACACARAVFGVPSKIFSEAKGKLCPNCKSKDVDESSFCRTCGAYPV